MKRLLMIVFLSLTAYAVFAQEDYELSEPDTILDLSKIHPSFPQLSAIKMSYQNRIQFLICQKFIRHFHNCLQ